VTKAFGGLVAVDDIDLDVVHGQRLGLLGPNGAGKTTLFNLIAGDMRPTSGMIQIGGVDCTMLASRHRAKLGVARTYQRTRLFGGLSVADNLYLAQTGKSGRHRALWRSALDSVHQEKARDAASKVWLNKRHDDLVDDLSHGERRQLEVAMALVTDPTILMLDEPASGLSQGERENLTRLLLSLPEELTLILIEHDMDVALKAAEHIVVMSEGKVVASGTTEEIRHDPVVHEIYLGEAERRRR
jgi:branched-chain amino acid transport system ATP-binding protein